MTLPEEDYYSVIFTFKLTGVESEVFMNSMTELMELASTFDGYLGEEGVRVEDGVSVFISYWKDEEAVKEFRDAPLHREIRLVGKKRWFHAYDIHIGKVIRSYSFGEEIGK